MITVGATMYRALEAADVLEQKYGLTVDFFDCRSINPLDYDPLIESVRKTGKVVLSSDACERGSVMHDIASNLSQLAFDELDAPPWSWVREIDHCVRRGRIRFLSAAGMDRGCGSRKNHALAGPSIEHQPDYG